MDDIVKAAMAKWPNVPDCYGWLGLDSRGGWYMRDDRVQAQGPFAPLPGEPGPLNKGSLLRHEKLIDFIHRNYQPDEQGRWYFQNGPQRVFVELELTPLVWRLGPDGSIRAHTGADAGAVQRVYLDEEGRLYLQTPLGLGIVHSADMLQAAEAVEAGRWAPESIRAKDLPSIGGYVPSPQRNSPPPSKRLA
jgi:hypothetical protein